MTTRALLAAVAATASLAACGSEGPTPAAAESEATNRKAMLDFARCMREHGVNMPDPQFEGGGRVRMMVGTRDDDPETVRAAEKACASHREKIRPPQLSEAEREEFRKRALAHARCMREQGIDMPDPQFDADGGAQMRLRGDIDPEDPKFRAAQEACRDTAPFARRDTDAGGER